MKILLQSYWFWPSLGGLESVSHVLAEGWAGLGHSVTVITNTSSDTERDVGYKVVRRPSWLQIARLVAEHDVIYSNGSTTHLFPFAVSQSKPFVWTHSGHSLKWLKNPTWYVNERSKEPGFTTGLIDAYRVLQVFGRWLVAQLADANITITNYMAIQQPLPRQRVIYNPVDYQLFCAKSIADAQESTRNAAYTFSYLGRLVKEKGVDDLLYALALLNQRRQKSNQPLASLQIIGDGADKPFLNNLADKLGIQPHISWRGALSGSELRAAISSGGIFVLPSKFEEPMGIVVVELMAAGKPLIVSLRGGLSECAGNACLTFANGDREALAEVMESLSSNRDLQATMVKNALSRVSLFNPDNAIRQYLDIFSSLLQERGKLP